MGTDEHEYVDEKALPLSSAHYRSWNAVAMFVVAAECECEHIRKEW